MKKLSISFLFSTILLFYCVSNAKAALVTVSEKGLLRLNVLGASTSEFNVRKVAQINDITPQADITLQKTPDGTQLIVENGSDIRELDLTGFNRDIIEIEAKEAPKKIIILNSEEGFVIKQNSEEVKTVFPIYVSSKSKEISVQTPSGIRYLLVFPSDALSSLIRSNELSEETNIELIETEKGDLSYKVLGIKNVNLFDIFYLDVNIEAYVSATTGQITKIDKPLWYRFGGVLL